MKKFKKIISVLISLSIIITAFSGLCVFAESRAYMLKADRVVSVNASGVYTDRTENERVTRRNNTFYFVFSDAEILSMVTEKKFSLYSQVNTNSDLTYYTFNSSAPLGVETEDWNTYLANPVSTGTLTASYADSALTYDLSSVSVTDGQTVIFKIGSISTLGTHYIGSCNHSACPPQIDGTVDMTSVEAAIVSKFNSATSANIISLIKSYKNTVGFDMSLFDTLSESEITGYMLDAVGEYTTLASIKNVYDTIGILVRGVEKTISADNSYTENSDNYFVFEKNPYASAMMMTEFRADLNGSLNNAQAKAIVGANEFVGSISTDNGILKIAFDFENLSDGDTITVEISGIDGTLASPVLYFKYDKENYENKVLQLINDASKENLEEILGIYSLVLDIDMTALDGVYVLGVMEILADISFASLSEILSEYTEAIEEIKAKYTAKEINPGKTVTLGNKVLYVFESAFEIKYAVDAVFSLTASENTEVKYYSSDEALPESNWESWLTGGASATAVYENGDIFAKLGSISGNNIVIETISGTNAVLSFKYDKSSFEAAILTEINNAAEADVTNTVLKYKKLFGIENEVPANADVSILNSELSNTVFTAFGEVKAAFDAALKKAVAPKKIMYATKVIATAKNDYTTFQDVTTSSTVNRYQVRMYYVFENIKYAGGISDIVFKVAGSDKGDGKISIYKISGNAPAGTDSAEWQAVLSTANRVATNILYSSTSPLVYNIPDITVSDGDTLILYVPNTDSRDIGSGGNTSYPPQITFKHKIRIYEKNITSASGAVTDFDNVPVASKYSFDFMSVGKISIDELKNSFSIQKSGGTETPLTAEVTETPYNGEDYYIYSVSFDIPMLDYNSNYSIKFNQNTVDEFGNGFKDASFDFKTEESSYTYSNGTVTANKNVKLLLGETTYSGGILNSLAIDIRDMTASSEPVAFSGIVFELMGTNPFEAVKAPSGFVNVTDADAQRVNKKIEINAGVGNMPVLAAVLPMTSAVSNAGENDIVSITESDLEANAKMFAVGTANASGIADIVWTVPNTTLSGDYVLYVKRNNGYSDMYYPFYYKNPTEQDIVFDILSGANTPKAQFETALISNEKLLGIDLTGYNALVQGKDIVISALYENRSNITGETVLKEMFDKEVLTQQINNITDAETLKTTLLANKAEYGIESSEIYNKVYSSQLSTYGISENLVFAELASYNITKADNMLSLFELAILKTAITNLANYRNSYDIVYSVNTTLGIDFTAYNGLGSNKDTALSKFVSAMANVTELSGVKGTFDTSVSTTTPGIIITLPAGGGGGGGGAWKPDKNLTAANMNEDKMEEVPQVENKPVFNDVSASHWAYSFIDRLSGSGFVNGYTDGNFNPDNYITRGEFISVVVRAFGLENSEAVCGFMDVDKESWYYPYVASAHSKGIVSGINHDFFAPQRNISRQDAAVIIVNLYKYLGAEMNASQLNFTDNEAISDYAENSIGYLTEKGVINGYTDGSFKPYNDITRAETCKIISQAIDIRRTVTE